MVNAQRLLKLLQRRGFSLAWEDWKGKQFNYDYVRPASRQELFEHIEIVSQGRKGEAVNAIAWVSLVRGHRTRFDERLFLSELCDGLPDVSYTLIESKDDAVNWERRVAGIAPARVKGVTAEKGEDILSRTEDARRAASRYVAMVRQVSDERVLEYLTYQLQQRTSVEQAKEADRVAGLARLPPTYGYGVNDAIEAAALAIVLFGIEVEAPRNAFAGESPSRNADLRLRLDILADRLRSQSSPS